MGPWCAAAGGLAVADEADNDPTRFWRHVAAALDGVRPGVAERVTGLLDGLQAASFEAVAARWSISWPGLPKSSCWWSTTIT
jgi:ATP/maltotriose-dependent transcriptional regulator MalT